MLTVNTYVRSACVASQSADGRRRVSSGFRLGHVLLLAIGTYLCFGSRLFAQTLDPLMTKEANKSWAATVDSNSNNLNTTRTIESQIQKGNRTLDERSVQIRGFDGHFENYQDIETETLQLDATTVRITTRTFSRDGNGRKTLVQVTEEERHTGAGGDSHAVRTTSVSDLNGRLQPVQRENLETTRIGRDVEETKTTVMLPSINGGFAPVLKTDELHTRVANDTVESQKTTLLSDGAGKWEISEIRQGTTRQEAHNGSTEERVFRRGSEGKLSEVSRVVSKELESTSGGEKRNLLETYSVDVPGTTRDGSLHLVERATTTERTSATGDQTTSQEEKHVFRRDSEGKLSEVSRVVSKESESASGEKRNLVETYSVDVPGITRNGSLHMVERATTNQRRSATGDQNTSQEVEQVNLGNPESGLRVSILINDTLRPGPSGEQAERTVRLRDFNGSSGVFSVDTTKADTVTTIQVQQTPAEKP